MASRYRQYLIEEKGMQQTAGEAQKSVNLTFLGGVEVSKTLLGVPYRAVKKLTSFAELKDTVLELQKEAGNSFQINMRYLEKDSSMSMMPTKLTYEGVLGGAKRV